MPIPEEEMAVYRATARERQLIDCERLSARYSRAWDLARQAAEALRSRYRVKHVVVFGSLVKEELFHNRSDIDLAVWGMAEKEYYRAVAHLLTLDREIGIDLIMVEAAPAPLRKRIEDEGVPV